MGIRDFGLSGLVGMRGGTCGYEGLVGIRACGYPGRGFMGIRQCMGIRGSCGYQRKGRVCGYWRGALWVLGEGACGYQRRDRAC